MKRRVFLSLPAIIVIPAAAPVGSSLTQLKSFLKANPPHIKEYVDIWVADIPKRRLPSGIDASWMMPPQRPIPLHSPKGFSA